MDVYQIDALMTQTRVLAANYYKTTQQALPVSNELAKYDAARLLHLQEPSETLKGVDLLGADGERFQIKSRVIFNNKAGNYRVGQINLHGVWDKTALVLLGPDYEPQAIYIADKATLEAAINENPNPNRAKRGAMSVAKFKAISTQGY